MIANHKKEKLRRRLRFENRLVNRRASYQMKEEVKTPLDEKLPNYPMWIRLLLFLEKSSVIFTLITIVITLVVYSSTVYAPQLWSKQYKKLKDLQGDERNLTATNEALKNQLAKQAEKPENGLINPIANNAVFLPPTPEPSIKRPKPLSQNKIPPITQPFAY